MTITINFSAGTYSETWVESAYNEATNTVIDQICNNYVSFANDHFLKMELIQRVKLAIQSNKGASAYLKDVVNIVY
jgi:hypothetical protein